jgi:hypothetical protein
VTPVNHFKTLIMFASIHETNEGIFDTSKWDFGFCFVQSLIVTLSDGNT